MFTSGEKMLPCPPRALLMERRWKANVELAPNCPRCNSSNTKFCYYNNYSLTQPRYFCKGCRRYWTKGGSLRNVPVGGGCRKNRRGRSVRISTDGTAARSNFGCVSGQSDLVADGRVGTLCDTASRSDASTIDLAAVYAKFLNQHPDSSDSEVVVPEFVGEFDAFDMLNASYANQQPPVQFPQEHDVVEHKNIPHPISENPSGDGNYGFLSEFCIDQKQEERIDEIPSIEMNNFGLQALLGEGICQDIDWLNCPVTPNFMWQLPQPQELEPVLEDHLITQSNLLNGNWSSFNMSASDIFSRI